MHQRCCIIGGGGYFGQHVAREMQRDGYHTVLLDLAFVDVDRDGFILDERKTTRIRGSLLDEALLEKALKKSSVCIHIAAYGMSGAPAMDPGKIFEINVHGTMQAMTACARFNVRKFVLASSVGVVFTNEELHNSTEDHPKPDNYYSHYSESKNDAEEFVLKANGAVVQSCALRFRGIFGPGEPRSTNRAAEAIAQGLYFAKFEKSRDALTQFSGVDNSAKAMMLAARALFTKPEVVGGQAYTIVDGGEPVKSWDFWNPLIETLGQKPPKVRIPYFLVIWGVYLNEIFYFFTKLMAPPLNQLEVNLIAVTNTYSIEKARRDLGYDPQNNHDLTEVCKYYSRYFLTHPVQVFDMPKIFTHLALFLLSILIAVVLYYTF
ncbi:hypothetical protein PFISCL1PPCAC_4482 [Pristionchus fissidentatus]|uniref:3-beta hydroxysteroid dehydrogenase/isomerase domain-containing protein n=1 Tax=Pristionchus fissidentatus TaxID=1538716 RepID=A0AAV5V5R5_9BILA|nr:hypothetical protein PFISCL1PPCAC_4482 [Pristionchus fissidentatus]